MLEEMFPMELLRVLLSLIGLGSAFMAGRTMAAARKGQIKAGRHIAWMFRAVICLAALAFRQSLDALMIGTWVLAAVAYAGGWWQMTHAKPPEDLSHNLVPRDE
jgi:hypothetical protein